MKKTKLISLSLISAAYLFTACTKQDAQTATSSEKEETKAEDSKKSDNKESKESKDSKYTSNEDKLSYGQGYQIAQGALERDQISIPPDAFVKGIKDGQKGNIDTEKWAYANGLQFGKAVNKEGIELNLDAIKQGIEDALAKKEAVVGMEEMREAINTIMQEKQKKQEEEKSKELEKNKKEGAEFLKKNKENKGIVVTESGLQYEVLTKGEGEKPSAEDTVEVHYKGTLINGEEFDSSYKREKPIKFPLNGVIKGWTEGVQLMNKGSKYKFYIPSDLAYGDRGNPGIPPGSTLIFEVELLDIIKKEDKKEDTEQNTEEKTPQEKPTEDKK